MIENTDNGEVTHFCVYSTVAMNLPVFNHGQADLKQAKAERVKIEKDLQTEENSPLCEFEMTVTGCFFLFYFTLCCKKSIYRHICKRCNKKHPFRSAFGFRLRIKLQTNIIQSLNIRFNFFNPVSCSG